MNYSVATEHYVLSIDTDYCFVLISKGNTWRRTMDPDMVRALAPVISRLTPADDKYAAQLWADISPMADNAHSVQPVTNRSVTVSMAFPPTGVSSCTPAAGPSTHRRFHPQPLRAKSFECTAYDSESEQVWKLHHWWRGPEHKATFQI